MVQNTHFQRLNPLIEELRQMVQATDLQPLNEVLRPVLDTLYRQTLVPPRDQFILWIWVYGNPTETEWAQIRAYLEGLNVPVSLKRNEVFDIPEEHCKIYWQPDWASTDFHILQSSQATAGLFLVTEEASRETAALLNHVALCADYLPVVTVVSSLDWTQYLDERQRINAPMVRTENWGQSEGQTFKQDGITLADPRVAELLQALHLGSGLERAGALAQQILQQEEISIKVKRQQAQQEEAVHRNRNSNAGSGITGELRNRLQFTFEQHERRNLEDSNAVLAAGSNGQIFKQMEAVIEQMPPLTEEKRAKNIAFTIAETYKQQWTNYFAQLLQKYCRESQERANDFIQESTDQVKRFLSEHNLALTLPAPALSDPSNLENIILQTLRFERNYEGTAVKKKPMEIMSGARMYFMMFMMLATMLGVGSLLRKEEFKMYFLPITILMLGLGVWQYLNTVQKETAENREKFSAAAKENLRSEAKRMLQEFSRLWERASLVPLRDWVQLITRESESAAQRAEQQIKGQRENESGRAKSIVESLRNQESNLQSVLRNKISFDKNLLKTRSDLQGLLRNQLVRYRAAPGAVSPSVFERETRRT